jgi:hypothetical protein
MVEGVEAGDVQARLRQPQKIVEIASDVGWHMVASTLFFLPYLHSS